MAFRVVVADDVDDLRFLLRLEFESMGEFEVVGEAATGAQVLRVVAESRPDVVVLDLDMPNMTGFEALPFLRQQNPETRLSFLAAAFSVVSRTERTPNASVAIGFSQNTCLFASMQAARCTGRNPGGVASRTTSTLLSITF